MDWDKAIKWLVRAGVVPYWDSTEQRPLFRGAAKNGYRVTRQSVEKFWPTLITALNLKPQENVKPVRRMVKRRLEAQNRL